MRLLIQLCELWLLSHRQSWPWKRGPRSHFQKQPRQVPAGPEKRALLPEKADILYLKKKRNHWHCWGAEEKTDRPTDHPGMMNDRLANQTIELRVPSLRQILFHLYRFKLLDSTTIFSNRKVCSFWDILGRKGWRKYICIASAHIQSTLGTFTPTIHSFIPSVNIHCVCTIYQLWYKQEMMFWLTKGLFSSVRNMHKKFQHARQVC